LVELIVFAFGYTCAVIVFVGTTPEFTALIAVMLAIAELAGSAVIDDVVTVVGFDAVIAFVLIVDAGTRVPNTRVFVDAVPVSEAIAPVFNTACDPGRSCAFAPVTSPKKPRTAIRRAN
jgi:hypothetical protein